MKNLSVYHLKIFFLILFVFSLPFESWDPFGIASFFSINKMAGFGYAAFCLLNIKSNFDVKYVLPTVGLAFLLWLWIGVQSAINYWEGTRFGVFNITLFQNIILFWLISTLLIRKPYLLKFIFISFVLSVFIMSILIYFGIGVEKDLTDGIGNDRLRFFGNNSNTLGEYLSVSIILVIYFFLYKEKYFGKRTYFLLLTIPMFLSLAGLTGSRGALVIIVGGIFILLLTVKTTLFQKSIIIIGGTGFLIYSIDTILENEILQERVAASFEEDGLGIREIIWQKALDIFYEYPFFGVGNTGHEREMLKVYYKFMDTHNLYLYLLVTGGVVGLFIFLCFFYKVWDSAWGYYVKEKDSIVLVLFFIYFFVSLKSGSFINDKFMWLLLAIIYSSKYGLYKK